MSSGFLPYFTLIITVVVVAVILTILAKLAIICYFCARRSMIRNAVVTDIQAVVANSGPVAARPTPACNVVPVWKVGAPTVEKFLQEVAKDNPIRFSAQQLCVFTNNYTKRLGSGGFGVVYEGKFPNGVKIAVKVLNRRSDGRAEEQFMAEVLTIGRTHHVNLVRLYGFCHDQYMSALVYEFLEKGSLDRYLFSETEAIGWNKLHEIAIGTAKGVAYLHEECHQRIIDYDIKPANILLDANFFPKVADFGLAKLCNRDNTHITMSGYRGTPGYIAPEFTKNYPVTYKCDVYSFGMVLFKILGARKKAAAGSSDPIDWFPQRLWETYEKSDLASLILACAIEEDDREKAEKMAMVAFWCVQDKPEARPPMSAVVKMLEGGVEIMPPPKPFGYWYPTAMRSLNLPGTSSSFYTCEETKSQWYKETTPIMAKYEIQIASSS